MIKFSNLNLLLLILGSSMYGQIKITDTNNSIPQADAILHLESKNNDKGFLLSRVNLVSIISASPLNSHESGLIVYNTATTTGINMVTPGLYYNDGTKWIRLSKNEKQFGDIKHSYQTTDHNGWYLLNGRTVSTLSTTARAVATALSFTTVLPNADDQLLRNKTNTQTLGTLSGVNNFTLVQANLPVINFTGNTTVNGAHAHGYSDNPITTQPAASGGSNPLLGITEISRTTGSSGSHTHTISFSLGGSSTPVNLKPKSLITNVFIYLGN